MEKSKLAALNQELTAYFDDLYAPDKKVYVFGDGDPKAKIVLIGEAPGEQETLMGKPFVGKAGRNLDEFLQLTGMHRSQLYITNVVKFRPVRISDKGRASNRTPTKEEIGLFLPWLKKEMDIIQPKMIVTLGNVPLHAVSASSTPIGQVHGTAMQLEDLPCKLFALYHPASIVYNPALRSTYIKDVDTFAQTARLMQLI